MALFQIIAIALAVVSTVASQVRARRQQRRAEKQLANARAITVKQTSSGSEARILIGETAAYGNPVYSEVASGLPFAPSGAGVIGRLGALAGRQRSVLLRQYHLSAGELDAVLDAWDDGDESYGKGALAGVSVLQLNPYGQPSPMATHFSAVEGPEVSFREKDKVRMGRVKGTGSLKRGANSRFTGQSVVTGAFHLRVKETDTLHEGPPEPFFFVRGAKARVLENGALSASRSYTNNIVDWLIEYCTAAHFGPGYGDVDFDLAACQIARDLCALKVQGPDEAIEDEAVPDPSRFNLPDGATYGTWFGNVGGFGIPGGRTSGFGDSIQHPADDDPTLEYGQFNGNLRTSEDFPEAIGDLLDARPGMDMFDSLSGKTKIVAPDFCTPESEQSVMTLTDAEIEGDLRIVPPEVGQRLNQITAKFADSNLNFAEGSTTFPRTGSPLHNQLLAEDGGQLLSQTITLIGVHNVYSARAAIWAEIMQTRRDDLGCRAAGKAFKLEPGDIITVSSARSDYARFAKVESATIDGGLMANLELKEYANVDVAWIVDDAQTVVTEVEVGPVDATPQALAAAIDDERIITLAITPADGEFAALSGYEIEERPVTPEPSEWTPLAQTGGQEAYRFPAADRRGGYEWRARAVSIGGRASGWSAATRLLIRALEVGGVGRVGADGRPSSTLFGYDERTSDLAVDGGWQATDSSRQAIALNWPDLGQVALWGVNSLDALGIDRGAYFDQDMRGQSFVLERDGQWAEFDVLYSPNPVYSVSSELPEGVTFSADPLGLLVGDSVPPQSFSVTMRVETADGRSFERTFDLELT